MNIDPMSDGLTRQRRNLISISCILIFLKFAGVEISELTFLGLDFSKLGNPSALYLVIWVFFGYFLFRYYQYFSQEGKARLSRYYYEEMNKHVMNRSRELANNVKEGANFHPNQLSTLKSDKWVIRVTHSGVKNDAGERDPIVEYVKFPINELKKYRVVSFLNINFHTSAMTDYILPFLVATVALIYCFSGSTSSLHEAIVNGFA
ncbi:MAG: hypothetical protein KZQ93_05680 [Candidatus Thiodiazotropha sp. (ex Monitilora ramsayi)]|nr:hypothetical protein [Candidatus Thiodiazotropha sp. (ex Monitilora ramsayi)]